MEMVSEITVIIKDDEKTLKSKYLIYDLITTDDNDPIIKDCVEKTLENFDGTPDDITVNIKIEMA